MPLFASFTSTGTLARHSTQNGRLQTVGEHSQTMDDLAADGLS